MAHRFVRVFSFLASLVLTGTATFAVAQSSAEPVFEVASIRQNLSSEPRWRMNFTPDGVTATDVTLQYAMREAYGVYDDQLWSGGPAWLTERRFDINAKFDVSAFKNPTLEQRRAMLQRLLADRCKLAVHHEPKKFPLYALVIAKQASKLQESKPEAAIRSSIYGQMCSIAHASAGHLEMKGCSLSALASHLTGATRVDLGRTIVDQTGLTSHYDIDLSWTPDRTPGSNTPDSGGPSIFTALEEQLGLKLKAIAGPLDTIVIDHVEMPSQN